MKAIESEADTCIMESATTRDRETPDGDRQPLDAAVSMLSIVPVAAYVCDREGRLLAFNVAAQALWGREPRVGGDGERWCGALRLFGGDGAPISHDECWMAKSIREGKPYLRRDIQIERPDGTRRSALANANPMFDGEGRVVGAVNTLVDVTELLDAKREAKRFAAELLVAKREAERAYNTSRQIFQQDPHCVKIVDDAGRLIDINAAGLRAIEADSVEQVRGMSSLEVVLPEWRETYLASLARALETGQSLCEFEIRGFRGTRRRMEQRAVRLSTGLTSETASESGGHILAVTSDVTDQRRDEERLRAATAELEEAQSVGKLGSWTFDVATSRVSWSKQIFRLFACDESRGVPALDEAISLYHPRDAVRLREHFTAALERGEPFSLVLRTSLHAEGAANPAVHGAKYVRAEARIRRDPTGRIVALFGTAMDVTAEVEREAALREARQRAEAASQSKTEFLANMSHEIRTPMTAILGYAELLAEHGIRSSAPPERLDHIETIRRNGEHLLAIINDILDISKIEAGRMTLELIPTRPDALLANVLLLMSVKAAAKGIALSGHVVSDVPESIRTDPVRLRQILMNLVGNAIKFTDHGSVRIELGWIAGPSPLLRFDVIDTGIGLDARQVDSLFEAFVQADSSHTRRYGGTGLGLRISKRLAEMLGGGISVSSEAGRGSTFSVSVASGACEGVPLLGRGEIRPAETAMEECAVAAPQASRGPAPSATRGPLDGARILLAEDGPDNRRLISHHLRRAGAELHTVENGRLAVEAMTIDGTVDGALRDPPPVDLVLTDMQMPVMDGYAMAALLRSKGCALPIIALTAHAMSGDRERCLAAGCSDYATKPIDRAELVRVCAKELARPMTERRRAA